MIRSPQILFEMARVRLEEDNPNLNQLTDADLEDVAELVVKIDFELWGIEGTKEEVRDLLLHDLKISYNTQLGATVTISDKNFQEWLPERKVSMEDNDEDWSWWDRYFKYLRETKPELGKLVRQKLDESTDEILGHCGDPISKEPWDRRGLVFGMVQAGKTSNYIGLINKAIDVGYSLIVVLTGLTNDLRAQGQQRVDQGVTGWTLMIDEDHREENYDRVGVNRRGDTDNLKSQALTNMRNDFRRGSTQVRLPRPGDRQPVIIVMKKNKTVMHNLIKYIEDLWGDDVEDGDKLVTDCPLLLIDDEADHGSVDTKRDAALMTIEGLEPNSDHDPTAINHAIRHILKLFEKSSYVAYTATPEATLQIPSGNTTDKLGDDLFPRDFIVDLPTPSNHFGPEKIFGEENREKHLPLWDEIPEEELSWVPPRHKKEHVPTWNEERQIPDSLKEAMRSFVVSCAIRNLRRFSGNASMLVHVTHFTAVQSQVRKQLEDARSLMVHELKYDRDSEMRKYESIWRDYQERTEEIRDDWGNEGEMFRNKSHGWNEVDWKDILKIVERIEFKTINGTSDDIIPESPKKINGIPSKNPRFIIVVGGQKLARGLTLPGLMVSYFQRTSNAYDTLMQMGRWFGYRDGYVDLCRLYTSETMFQHFWSIGVATEDMRKQFRSMKNAGKTPREYGIYIQNHPNLRITSAMKMRYSHNVKISFSGQLQRTLRFAKDNTIISKNLDSVAQLFKECGEPTKLAKPGKFLCWKNQSSKCVVDFLQSYDHAPGSLDKGNKDKSASDLPWKYIIKEKEKGLLKDWTIVLMSPETNQKFDWKGNGYTDLPFEESGVSIRTKSRIDADDDRFFNYRQIEVASSRNCDLLDLLSSEQRKEALENTIADWEDGLKKNEKPSIPSLVQQRILRDPDKGLIWVYLINNPDDENSKPLVSYSLEFPETTGRRTEFDVIVQAHMYKQLELGID